VKTETYNSRPDEIQQQTKERDMAEGISTARVRDLAALAVIPC
jgi:hypothetical protein